MQEKLQNIDSIKERIIYFIESQRFRKGDFFDKIEVTSANFRGNQLKSSLNSTTIERIITLFPQLNLYWLILGKGEMLLNIPAVQKNNEVNEPIAKYSLQMQNDTKKIIHLLEEQVRELRKDKEELYKIINK